MARVPTPPVITCDQWNAEPALHEPVHVRPPERIIFHHTAGHHPEILRPQNESRQEAIRYAQAIQYFHMHDNGWFDSGHNFLVCRNGLILTGRWHSFTAIRSGVMVLSAHCPGQNDQPGIEHEHAGREAMTPPQLTSSSWLMAWIIDRCRMRSTGTIHPHHDYIATNCPGHLLAELPELRRRVINLLNHYRSV